jgi:MYXO-CTERM domain-containing protein
LTVAMLGARVASADPIDFTGYVWNDFNPNTNPQVQVIPGMSDPLNIGQPTWMNNSGWYSGFAIKDIRTYYNAANDTMYVGVNTFINKNGTQTIAGDSYGSGTFADPNLQKLGGGVNPAGLAGDKSITIAFAPDSSQGPTAPGTPAIVAGVPADKSKGDPGMTDGFTVSSYNGLHNGLAYNYGTTLPQFTGNLAFDPGKVTNGTIRPGFEFTIPNFSQIPGLKGSNGLWLEAYAGSAQDGAVGETQLPFYRIPFPSAQTAPEPATLALWSLVAVGAAWRLRRRRPED